VRALGRPALVEKNQAHKRPHRRIFRAGASLFPLPAAGVGTAVKQALGQEELLQPLGIAAVKAGVTPPAPESGPSPLP
jgi:hypothetical protein